MNGWTKELFAKEMISKIELLDLVGVITNRENSNFCEKLPLRTDESTDELA